MIKLIFINKQFDKKRKELGKMASANSNGRNGPWDDASYAQHGCCDVMIQWVELVGGDRFTARGVCVCACVLQCVSTKEGHGRMNKNC